MIFEAHDKTVGWYKQSTYEAKEYNPRHLPVIRHDVEYDVMQWEGQPPFCLGILVWQDSGYNYPYAANCAVIWERKL